MRSRTRETVIHSPGVPSSIVLGMGKATIGSICAVQSKPASGRPKCKIEKKWHLPAYIDSARTQQSVGPIPLIDGRWMGVRPYGRPGTFNKPLDSKECALKAEVVLSRPNMKTLLNLTHTAQRLSPSDLPLRTAR